MRALQRHIGASRAALAGAIAFLVPAIAFADTPRTFADLVKNLLVPILNAVAGFLVLAAVAAYLWGILRNVNKAGEQRANMKYVIMWGILALFVMVSIWGILRLVETTLFGDAAVIG
ncbi:MAG: hypothetical protein JO019_01640 [Candidatus Kaiserbacteria bacterium]|nr:hypothetical protein [Candidatus Kaiserbacteria bacterium]